MSDRLFRLHAEKMSLGKRSHRKMEGKLFWLRLGLFYIMMCIEKSIYKKYCNIRFKKKNCNFNFKETLTITVYSSDIQNPDGCVYCTWAWVGDSFLGPAVRLGFI